MNQDAAPAQDIDALVDGQRFGGFGLNLLIWSFLATYTDGFGISSLGLAASHISREWHVPPGSMGVMMSASLFGMLIGAPLFGLLGDRYGRRPVIALGCLLFGTTTLAVIFTHNIGEIAWLRVLTGIGMGGVMPNVIALSSESSPKRLRARLTILMFMGITLGATLPGVIAAWLVPAYGWKTIFLIGGPVAMVVGIVFPFVVPESVKFLAMRPDRHSQLVATLRRMRPDLALQDETRIATPHMSAHGGSTSVAPLFAGGLAPITLLLWVCFAVTLMANFFLSSWLPSLFKGIGIDDRTAALTATMYQFGGAFGGLAMSLLLDRLGFLAVGGALLLAVPAMLAIAVPGMPPVLLALVVGFAGFCVLSAQFGSNAAAGLIYPTAYRSKGLGLAFAVGRVGSIIGPMLGARLIGAGLPLMVMFGIIVTPVLLGSVAGFVLANITRSRFGGWRLEEAGSVSVPRDS